MKIIQISNRPSVQLKNKLKNTFFLWNGKAENFGVKISLMASIMKNFEINPASKKIVS